MFDPQGFKNKLVYHVHQVIHLTDDYTHDMILVIIITENNPTRQ